MIEVPETYSDSWYRVASQSIALRPQVVANRQWYRGQKWIVVRDPYSNSFFRMRSEAYDFVARLRVGRTVEEVWLECLERHPDTAPGQEEIIRLLAQLYHANLLHYDLPEDSATLFERYRKRRQREVRGRLLQIMFARFPLLDPDQFLCRFMPLVRWLIGPIGAVLWLAVIALAAKVCAENANLLWEQTQGVLAPSNWLLLYAALVILKIIHEYGHAFACRRFGGEVHVMGVMLLVFTPIPYMDASSSWAFQSRWQRCLVAAAGMIVEVFVAAVACLIWASTGPGTLHSLCYNMMLIASVSTILFNINPLLRFDGYYILSDVLDMPNLHGRARQQLHYLVERYGFGVRQATPSASTGGEAVILVVFGVLSQAYRIVVFAGIILFVADKFLLAGLLMAVICVLSWVVVPCGRLLTYLSTSPRLDRTRKRAVAVTCGCLGLVVAGLAVVPMPNAFRAPGVLETAKHATVSADTAGVLQSVVAVSGREVKHGDVLLTVHDPELAYAVSRNAALLRETAQLEREALSRGGENLAALARQRRALAEQAAYLQRRVAQQQVTAPFTGTWVTNELDSQKGRWLARGTALGTLSTPQRWRFVATVPQADAKQLFDRAVQGAEVRLYGTAAQVVGVSSHVVAGAEHRRLPSAAIGWGGGGPVAVDADDRSGRQAQDSFYTVIAELETAEHIALRHGQTGYIRFVTGAQPLLSQWARRLRQMLQQRYNL